MNLAKSTSLLLVLRNRFFVAVVALGFCIPFLSDKAKAQGCDVTPSFVSESKELKPQHVFVFGINGESSKVHKTIFRNGRLILEKLSDGKYVIISRFEGHKTSISSVDVDCSNWNSGPRVGTEIVLCRGTSDEFFVTEPLVAKVVGPDLFTRTRSIESICSGADQRPAGTSAKAANPSRVLAGGVLNGNALSLPRPAYPPAAQAVRASGTVTVEVLIDEKGNVVSAATLPVTHYFGGQQREKRSLLRPFCQAVLFE